MFVSPLPGPSFNLPNLRESSISPNTPSTVRSQYSQQSQSRSQSQTQSRSGKSALEIELLTALGPGASSSTSAAGSSAISPKSKSRSPETDTPEQIAIRKVRLRRSRLACLECRDRKSKCNAVPPHPCPTCVSRETICHWPSEDGRSNRLKRKRERELEKGVMKEEKGSKTTTQPAAQHTHAQPTWWQGTAGQEKPALISPPIHTNPEFIDSTLLDLLQPPQNGRNAPVAPQPPPTTTTSQYRHPQIPQPQAQLGQIPPESNMTADWLWALSSQMPLVFEDVLGSQPVIHPDRSALSNPPAYISGPYGSPPRIVRITWYRPHGQTAIAPGLKRITLKVRVSKASENGLSPDAGPVSLRGGIRMQERLDLSDGLPPSLIKHLLEVFERHFACQYPFFDRLELERQFETGTASLFMLYSIAAMAARFSNHPAIALPHLEPWAYGNVFYDRAKAMLGSMLAVPSRETIFSFLLLANLGYANDSEAEIWNLTGLAVRMSIDLALHLSPPEDSTISAEDCRLNRLVFWAVLIMDHSIAHGAGRQTAFPLEDITQTLPTEDDIISSDPLRNGHRSPFVYTSKLMLLYGPIINQLNRQKRHPSRGISMVDAAQATALREYNQLPVDMQWNVMNLQKHIRANQGPIFVHLHLWMHTILTTAYLASTIKPVKPTISTLDGLTMESTSGSSTPSSNTASHLWRNSVRIIGDILAFSDIFDSFAYCALPHVTQAFFAAGCCYALEMEEHKHAEENLNSAVAESSITTNPNETTNLSRAILTTVASNNISALRQGLKKMATYWSGVEWIEATLAKRIEGVQDVDLVDVTEKLKSFVNLPDEGLARRRSNQVSSSNVVEGNRPYTSWDHGIGSSGAGNPSSWAQDMGGLPFELDFSTMEVEGLEEQDIPVPHFI